MIDCFALHKFRQSKKVALCVVGNWKNVMFQKYKEFSL